MADWRGSVVVRERLRLAYESTGFYSKINKEKIVRFINPSSTAEPDCSNVFFLFSPKTRTSDVTALLII